MWLPPVSWFPVGWLGWGEAVGRLGESTQEARLTWGGGEGGCGSRMGSSSLSSDERSNTDLIS